MSLINQMLKDIDKRQAGRGVSYSMDQGIRSSNAMGSRSLAPIVLLLLALAVVMLAYLFWDRISAKQHQGVPTPVAAPAAAPPQVVVVVPATPNAPGASAGAAVTSEYALGASAQPAVQAPMPPQAVVTQPPIEKQRVEPPSKVTTKTAAATRGQASDADKPGQVLKAPTVEQQSVNLLRKAESQVRQGQLKDAQATLDQALAMYAANQDARLLLSRIQLQEGQLDVAIATLKQGLSDRGNSPEYHATLGQLLQRKERHDDAIAQYVVALKRSPNNAQWLVGLAISLQAKGQMSASAEAYQQALDIGTLPPGLASFAEQRLRQIAR